MKTKRTFLNGRSVRELQGIAKELNYEGISKIDDSRVLVTMLSGHTEKVLLQAHKSRRTRLK